MAGANGHAIVIEDGAQVMGMQIRKHKGDHCRTLLCLADDADAWQFTEHLQSVIA